ncbi:MAG: PA0069 family radical SAM protein [Gammaproteobacteria bacterium]|nr:PA0069 family radical SAM protein [Gammaproteobacteria bacterium]
MELTRLTSRPPGPVRGRGAASNAVGRYESLKREAFDDGWDTLSEVPAPLRTQLDIDRSRKVIAYNQSPDIPFDRSLNPYRGCEHGCVYCFARPSHAWFGLSPGLDFESRLFYKPDAPAVLARELRANGYKVAPIAVGANTDAYQPVDRKLALTRQLIEVLAAHRHPLTVITKSSGVERDIDLLAELADANLASVAVSITTLNPELARRMEPRASAPRRRLETVRRLRAAGIPVTVMMAPVIPTLTDPEIEALLGAASQAGANDVRYILLRLPRELTTLFDEWLCTHYPLQRDRVLNNLRDTQGGALYDARWNTRMTGTGPFAEAIAMRFRLAKRRLGFAGVAPLDTNQFGVPEDALSDEPHQYGLLQ